MIIDPIVRVLDKGIAIEADITVSSDLSYSPLIRGCDSTSLRVREESIAAAIRIGPEGSLAASESPSL